MKNLLLILLVLLINTAVDAQSRTFKNAVSYNDFIVNLQDSIGRTFIKLNEIIGNDKVSKAEMKAASLQQLEKCKTVIKANISTLQKVNPFAKGEKLKSSAIDLFNYYYKTMDVHYRKIIELMSTDKYTEEMIKQLEEIEKTINVEEKVFDEAYIGAQADFAKQHGFELTPNKLEEEFKK